MFSLDENFQLKCDFFTPFQYIDQLQGDELEGNIRYMAPEIIKENDLIISQTQGTYSFGVLALQLLTGQLLYEDQSLYQVLESKEKIEKIYLKEKLSFVSKRMRNLIEDCLNKDASLRPSFEEIHKYFSSKTKERYTKEFQQKIVERI